MSQWVITCSQESPPQIVVAPDGSLGLDCPTQNLIVVPADKFGLGSLLNLSVEDAVELTGYILLLWAVAWGVRAVIRALKTSDGVVDYE